MKESSRTKNAIINSLTGSMMQIVNVILGLVSRTIFINLLNLDYLGVNSLFSNILTILSFAELGFGNAIVFSLYKPIAEQNRNKILALMKFYKKVYRIIGTFIFVVGLCIIPFMGYIIKDVPDIKENLILIYVLFLLNTSVSYLFNYKKTLIIAYQKDYIVQVYTRVFQLVKVVLECLFLLLTHEYLTYLVIQIVFTIVLNITLSFKANKMYPFLKGKNNNELSDEETKTIYANVKALFVYKLGSVILNGTDNIIISFLNNISVVGIASNYTMLINSIVNVIGGALNSLTASVGNLSVKGNKYQIRTVMHQLLMLCVWLYGFVVIGFSVLANEFMGLWLGQGYQLEQSVIIAILFSVYINGVQYAAFVFRTTQGLFVQSRWVPMISAAMNIILSIWWGKVIGIAGVFAATGVSRLLTTTIVDPWMVYKNNFKERPYEYYCKYFIETAAVVINAIIQMWFVGLISLNGWYGFFVKVIVICFSTNVVFLLEFGWTKDFKLLIRRIFPKVLEKIKK